MGEQPDRQARACPTRRLRPTAAKGPEPTNLRAPGISGNILKRLCNRRGWSEQAAVGRGQDELAGGSSRLFKPSQRDAVPASPGWSRMRALPRKAGRADPQARFLVMGPQGPGRKRQAWGEAASPAHAAGSFHRFIAPPERFKPWTGPHRNARTCVGPGRDRQAAALPRAARHGHGSPRCDHSLAASRCRVSATDSTARRVAPRTRATRPEQYVSGL